MHIALFGGAFDPPHLGHEQVALSLLESIVEQVWLIPCYKHPFQKDLTETSHRLAMLSFLETKTIFIDPYETTQDTISYSYDTLCHFQQSQPNHKFSWIMGSDQLKSFHQWKDYDQLLKNFKVYVYPRTGFPFDPLFEGMVPLTTMTPIDVSSTLVRKRVAQGRPIEGLVRPEVRDYISNYKLYQEE